MQSPTGRRHRPGPDQAHHLLAMFEAEVGSLLELLPVPLLVTSESGTVLRVNSATLKLLGPVVGQNVDEILSQLALSVRMRTLSHGTEVRRLYVLAGVHC